MSLEIVHAFLLTVGTLSIGFLLMKNIGEQLISLTSSMQSPRRRPQMSLEIGQGDDSDLQKLINSAYDQNGTIAKLVSKTSDIASDVANSVSSLAKSASGILQTVKNYTGKDFTRSSVYGKIADGETVILRR